MSFTCATRGKVEDNGICGVAVPTGFNECVGAGRPFETCIAGGSKQLRRACDPTHPCGPDYVCAAVPNGPASTVTSSATDHAGPVHQIV